MKPNMTRELVAGPDDGPEPPFPIKLWGPVIKGFGRGSKELGIPTANIPPEGLSKYPDIKTGVYYGFVGLSSTSNNNSNSNSDSHSNNSNNTSESESSTTSKTYPAVLSIGYNPFYKNTIRSVEIHILHSFPHDFYGASLNLLMLGFIRPEYDYVSKESLIDDIKTDCEVAKRSLKREAYKVFEGDGWLREFGWAKKVDVEEVEKDVLRKS